VRRLEENLPRSGRGRKTGVRVDRIMYRMLRSDRRQSLGEITSFVYRAVPFFDKRYFDRITRYFFK
jgi:hypothetical protein